MMRIINKIYIWFKKVILNILGVIRDMINKDNEVKILVIETIRDGIKNIFNSRNNRAVLGIFTIIAGVGIGGGLLASAYIKLPDDEGESDNEN